MINHLMFAAGLSAAGLAAIAYPSPARSDPPPLARHNHHVSAVVPAADDAGARPGHRPGVGNSYPASDRASNIGGADTRSDIAPRLPDPRGGDHASSDSYLRDAQRALATRRTGEAQESLERAQTRLLDRSVPQDETNVPVTDPMAALVEQARQALGRGDAARANELITRALNGRG